jgi:hypothetical protein
MAPVRHPSRVLLCLKKRGFAPVEDRKFSIIAHGSHGGFMKVLLSANEVHDFQWNFLTMSKSARAALRVVS